MNKNVSSTSSVLVKTVVIIVLLCVAVARLQPTRHPTSSSSSLMISAMAISDAMAKQRVRPPTSTGSEEDGDTHRCSFRFRGVYALAVCTADGGVSCPGRRRCRRVGPCAPLPPGSSLTLTRLLLPMFSEQRLRYSGAGQVAFGIWRGDKQLARNRYVPGRRILVLITTSVYL